MRKSSKSVSYAVPHRSGAFDWVIPAAAVLGLGLAALAAMQAGGTPSQQGPALTRAAIIPIGATAEPGAPRIASLLGSSSGAVERCDARAGTCRALPVDDQLYRMSDGSEWLARTAYDDQGGIAFTQWFDGEGAMVGAPMGL